MVPQRLNVEIMIDPTLVEDPEIAAKCPKDAPKRIFPLDLDENLVGRRSDTKGVLPGNSDRRRGCVAQAYEADPSE